MKTHSEGLRSFTKSVFSYPNVVLMPSFESEPNSAWNLLKSKGLQSSIDKFSQVINFWVVSNNAMMEFSKHLKLLKNSQVLSIRFWFSIRFWGNIVNKSASLSKRWTRLNYLSRNMRMSTRMSIQKVNCMVMTNLMNMFLDILSFNLGYKNIPQLNKIYSY